MLPSANGMKAFDEELADIDIDDDIDIIDTQPGGETPLATKEHKRVSFQAESTTRRDERMEDNLGNTTS